MREKLLGTVAGGIAKQTSSQPWHAIGEYSKAPGSQSVYIEGRSAASLRPDQCVCLGQETERKQSLACKKSKWVTTPAVTTFIVSIRLQGTQTLTIILWMTAGSGYLSDFGAKLA
jgi:hypothetical protein